LKSGVSGALKAIIEAAASPRNSSVSDAPPNDLDVTILCREKVDLLANQHVPTGNMNAVRAVNSSSRWADAGGLAHVVPARAERRLRGARVATVATF
jgi:hypothetical protein